jgi:hypothetical protein
MPKTAKKQTRQPRAAKPPDGFQQLIEAQSNTLSALARIESFLKNLTERDATPPEERAPEVIGFGDHLAYLGRIATALENLVAQGGVNLKPVENVVVVEAAPKAPRKPRAEKAPEAAPAEQPKPQMGVTKGECGNGCGTVLTNDNSSTSPSGRVTHINCPKAVPAEAPGRALKVVEPEPATEAPKVEEKAPAVPTFEQLREAALECVKRHNGDKKPLTDLIASLGASKISEIPDARKAEALAAMQKA